MTADRVGVEGDGVDGGSGALAGSVASLALARTLAFVASRHVHLTVIALRGRHADLTLVLYEGIRNP